jgi:hypothetical protein
MSINKILGVQKVTYFSPTSSYIYRNEMLEFSWAFLCKNQQQQINTILLKKLSKNLKMDFFASNEQLKLLIVVSPCA